jgi:hypothetical protein
MVPLGKAAKIAFPQKSIRHTIRHTELAPEPFTGFSRVKHGGAPTLAAPGGGKGLAPLRLDLTLSRRHRAK